MTDFSLGLQGAIVTRLRAAGIAGGRVYDATPDGSPFPYVSLGPSDAVPDDAECVSAWSVTQQIDVWSRETGYPETRRIASAVLGALHRAEFPIEGAHLTEIVVRQVRYQRDPDGLTSHGIIEVRALIESE